MNKLVAASASLLSVVALAQLSPAQVKANEAKGVRVYKNGPNAQQKAENRTQGVREYSKSTRDSDRVEARNHGVKEYSTSFTQGGGIGSAGELYGFLESRKMVAGAKNSFTVRGGLTAREGVKQPLMTKKDLHDWLKNWGVSADQIDGYLATQPSVGPIGAGLDEARAWLVHKGVKKAAKMSRDEVAAFIQSTNQTEWVRPDAMELEQFLVKNGSANAAQIGTQLWKLGTVSSDESTLTNLDASIKNVEGYGVTKGGTPEALRSFFHGMFTTRAGHKVSKEEDAANEADKHGTTTEY